MLPVFNRRGSAGPDDERATDVEEDKDDDDEEEEEEEEDKDDEDEDKDACSGTLAATSRRLAADNESLVKVRSGLGWCNDAVEELTEVPLLVGRRF